MKNGEKIISERLEEEEFSSSGILMTPSCHIGIFSTPIVRQRFPETRNHHSEGSSTSAWTNGRRLLETGLQCPRTVMSSFMR